MKIGELRAKIAAAEDLPADEFKALVLSLIRPHPRGRRRLNRDEMIRKLEMAIACHNRTIAGASVKDAVAATARDFDVDGSTVRAARGRLKRKLASQPWLTDGNAPSRSAPSGILIK